MKSRNFYSDRENLNREILISDSVMDIVDLRFSTFNQKVSVRNCVINHLLIHSSFFINGFTIDNCVVKEKVQFEMGGHNKSPIVIHNNIFCGLFVFFDCQFDEQLSILNNIFKKGSTLFNKTNTFEIKPEVYGNIGVMNVEAIE